MCSSSDPGCSSSVPMQVFTQEKRFIMAGYSLAVFSDSFDYIHHFLAYCRDHDTPFDVSGFTDPQSLKAHLKTCGIDILLLPRGMEHIGIINLKSEKKIGEIVYLGEQRDLESSPKEILMYQPMSYLLSDLEAIANASFINRPDSDPDLYIVGIFALDGDASPGDLAILLSDSPEFSGKKVLYIDLDSFSGFSYEHSLKLTGSLSDLIFYYTMGSDELAYALKQCVVQLGSIHYVAPAVAGDDPDEIAYTQWRSFVTAIAAAGNYSVVIFNLRSNCRNFLHMFAACRKIYLFANSYETAVSGAFISGYSGARALAFHDYFIRNERPDILLRMEDGYEIQAGILQNASSKTKKFKDRWKKTT